MLHKVFFSLNVLFKDGCFNGILNGVRGFVPQKLQTRGCSGRNDHHQCFPVMKNSSRISRCSILPHCSDKTKYVPFLLSLFLYPYLSMEKRLFKIWKHKLIPRRRWGGSIRMQRPRWPVSKYRWNSARVTSESSEGPYTALPPWFLTSTVQITQRICAM